MSKDYCYAYKHIDSDEVCAVHLIRKTKKELLAHLMDLNNGAPWKQLYGNGFRIVKVRIVEVK